MTAFKKQLHTYSILLLALFWAFACGCGQVQESPLVRVPVYYEVDLNSSQGKALLTPGGYLRITEPNIAYSAIGVGGLLIVCGTLTDGSGHTYYAYDLACPVEQNPAVKLTVNASLNAECPSCHTQYSILYGGGNSLSPAHQAPLLRYRVLQTGHRLRITN